MSSGWPTRATGICDGRALDEVVERDAHALGGRLGHLGLDEAGGDRVGGHAELAELDREGLGEALQTGLGGRVVGLAAVAERRDAGQVDDPAPLRPRSCASARRALIRNAPRRCTFMTMSQSVSVILNSMLSRVTPALLTSTVGAPSSAATRSTAASHLLGVADVGTDGQRLAAGGLDRLDGALGRRLVEVEHGDGEPVLRQSECGRGTDAAGRAGHDGHPGCPGGACLAHETFPSSGARPRRWPVSGGPGFARHATGG